MMLLSLSTAKMAMPLKKSEGLVRVRGGLICSQDESQGAMIQEVERSALLTSRLRGPLARAPSRSLSDKEAWWRGRRCVLT